MIMKREFEQISIKLNASNSRFNIGSWVLEEDDDTKKIIIRDKNGNFIIESSFIFEGNGNYHVKCCEKEFLVYVNENVLNIVEKL